MGKRPVDLWALTREPRSVGALCDSGAVDVFISAYHAKRGDRRGARARAIATVRKQWQGVKAKEITAVEKLAMQIIRKAKAIAKRGQESTIRDSDFVRLPTRM